MFIIVHPCLVHPRREADVSMTRQLEITVKEAVALAGDGRHCVEFWLDGHNPERTEWVDGPEGQKNKAFEDPELPTRCARRTIILRKDYDYELASLHILAYHQRTWNEQKVGEAHLPFSDLYHGIEEWLPLERDSKYAGKLFIKAKLKKVASKPPKKKEKPKPPVQWRAPASYPQLHPGLEGHLYSRPSRLGAARWRNAEIVVGTRSWYQANGGSFKRRPLDARRHEWQPLAQGAVHSELSGTGVPRWPVTSSKALQRSRSSFTSKASLFLSQQIPGKKKENLLKFKGSQSLPSIEMGQHPYPPSPAFIRDFMRRLNEKEQ